MKHFSKDMANKILTNQIDAKALSAQYQDYKEEVMNEFGTLSKDSNADDLLAIMDKYKSRAKLANDKISKSKFNQSTINTFLPEIIKARIALYILDQLNTAAASKNVTQVKHEQNATQVVRFSQWDGRILQKLLFKRDFERKPVSLPLFKMCWPLIGDKKILMPLVNKKGIYCFYTSVLLRRLKLIIGDQKCIEIAAGDGTLTRFLNNLGTNCVATDDYSWGQYISYPESVEKIDAKAALAKYQPKVVICSWPAPGNNFEKHVFKTDSVKTYIVIGTKSPQFTGDFESYNNQGQVFDMQLDEVLSSYVLPPTDENAVYIFRRK